MYILLLLNTSNNALAIAEGKNKKIKAKNMRDKKSK